MEQSMTSLKDSQSEYTAAESAIVQVRLPLSEKAKHEDAARAMGQTLSAYVRATLARETERLLPRNSGLIVDDAAFREIETLLSGKAHPSTALKTLLTTKAPWD